MEIEDINFDESPHEEDDEEEELAMEIGGIKKARKKRGRGEEDEEEDDAFDMTQNMATKSAENSDDEDYPYEVLSPDEVVKHMNDSIEQVNFILQLPPTVTRLLLNHFKWDKDKLTERYYDDDQEKFFSDIRIPNPFKALPAPPSLHNGLISSSSTYVSATSIDNKKRSSSKSSAKQPQQLLRQQSYDCEICCEPADAISLTGLKCGHNFCSSCWSKYLCTKILDEGMGESIYCPAHGCEVLVDDERVMSLLTDPTVKVKYQHLITNSFVEYNKCLRWCSAPNCNYVIKVSHFEAKPVRCKCGHYFCFACGENWHDPVQCNWLKRWIKKCDDDSETSNWIAANTRECPKCRATIEKDGGCNHMLCKRCKFDFCWVCLGPWEPHGSSWYNCNRYDEDAAKKARDAQEKSRAALQRYLFYCNRYMNHMQSLKFENRLYTSVGQKMEELQQHNMSWIEVQFLKKAVDILCQCRQTLMYTYVFAFYLKKNNQSIIFEDNQKDLEIATEQLSEYLERYITLEMLVDIKQKVQDKYRYCESRRKVLLDHVHEGYDKDLWDYQDINI